MKLQTAAPQLWLPINSSIVAGAVVAMAAALVPPKAKGKGVGGEEATARPVGRGLLLARASS